MAKNEEARSDAQPTLLPSLKDAQTVADGSLVALIGQARLMRLDVQEGRSPSTAELRRITDGLHEALNALQMATTLHRLAARIEGASS